MTPIDSDPWYKRDCTSCGEAFRPSRKYNAARALRVRCCSPACSAKLGSLAAHAKPRAYKASGRATGTFAKELSGVDLVPCTHCGLRGHEAGDPDRCLGSSKLYQRGAGGAGLGGQPWI